ncbi:MAG: aminopeptidase P family protein [Bacteroidales bacterium]|nr:aminopeptidase P family protein [Bacteroidales bacterium]
MNTIQNDRLLKVRTAMQKLGLDALIVRTEDPHCSEYPADHWKFREYLSGFNGSAGVLVITNQHVGLWVDSRYYIQAEAQTRDVCLDVFKDGLPGVPSYIDWLTYTLPSDSVCGIDGFTVPYSEYLKIENKLNDFGIKMVYKVNIINELYVPRTELPLDEIIEMDYSLNQLTRQEKVSLVRERMLQMNASHYLLSTLDDIAWLMNLRGTDVEYNPVFYSHVIITPEEEHLYVDPHKLTNVISKRLDEEGIKVSLYDHFEKNVSNIPAGSRVLFDPNKINARVIKALGDDVIKVEAPNIVEDIKAVKTETEIKHITNAHIKDGVAMVNFLHWLNGAFMTENLTELSVAEKLLEFRQQQPGFVCESFGAISAFGPNSAMCHYEPTIETNARISDGFLLLDTGGQYADGTTDITRTVAMGQIADKQACIDYTLVLKGHIALARAVFPEGTHASQLDSLARMAMWQHHIDYGHGTGHGVGFYLNVHEGPQRIGKKDNGSEMKAGYVTTDEPGIYREGKWGIRTENVVVCKVVGESDFGKFLGFYPITMCPIDKRPILVDMLTNEEKEWLNAYHKLVYETLSPLVSEEVRQWLQGATDAI